MDKEDIDNVAPQGHYGAAVSGSATTPGDTRRRRLKVCLACSHGGHLTEMLQLLEAFDGHDTFYFCYDAETTRSLENAYRVPNMARNPVEFVRNLARLVLMFRREQPGLVVSTGAEIAIPIAIISKLYRVPIIYIECGAQVAHPSFTGRLMYWLADAFYVQWRELNGVYGPRARFRGSLIDEDSAVKQDHSDKKRLKCTLIHPAQPDDFSSAQPPMGLGYIASALEQQGCEVHVIDANAEKLSPDAVVSVLVQQRPDMVCFSVTTPMLPGTLDIAGTLRDPGFNPVLVAGGAHATVRPDDLLADGLFDYVVRGEGESTVVELVAVVEGAKDPSKVPGLSRRNKNGEVVHNPDRPLCRDIDQLPYPDWSLFPLRRYSSLVRRNDYCLPIATSRGCPFGCTFCYKGIFGKRIRLRDPKAVVDEWEFLIRRYNVREVAVLDDAFTFDTARVIAICELLIERGLNKVPWSTTNGIRVDRVSPEMFSAMRRAGCYRVYFGIESGVQSIINRLQKGIDLEQARYAVKSAKDAGLEVGGYFMLGNLGETDADMDATISFALDLGLDYAQFSIATPYPGTLMYDQVLEEGRLLIESWDELATYGRLVFTAGELTPGTVARKFRKAIVKFYLRPGILLRQLRQSLHWVGLKHRILGFITVLKLAVSGGSGRRRRKRVRCAEAPAPPTDAGNEGGSR